MSSIPALIKALNNASVGFFCSTLDITCWKMAFSSRTSSSGGIVDAGTWAGVVAVLPLLILAMLGDSAVTKNRPVGLGFRSEGAAKC